MDDFRAIPQMAEALQEMVAKGQARLATVVAVYPNEVDASLSDGSVGRFATTHNGLKIGQKGVLLHGLGGSRIFTPLGLHEFRPMGAAVYLSQTISTAGSIIFDAPVVISNLNPNIQYGLSYSLNIYAWTPSANAGTTAAGRGRFEILREGLVTVQGGGPPTYLDYPTSGHYHSGTSTNISPSLDGVITVKPAIAWISGTITTYWGGVIINNVWEV